MNLVYLVAVGEVDRRFIESVRWCVTSLRTWGRFEGDVVVVSDQDPDALKASLGGEARVVTVDPIQLIDPGHGRRDGEKYQMARLCVHRFVDLAPYALVMYLDADILAVRDVAPLFEEVEEFRYAREFQPMSAPMYNASLSDAELEQAKWRRGVSSGVFVAPASYLPECLEEWKRELDRAPDGDAYDQPALNALVLRERIRARPLPAFSVAYPVLSDFPDHYRPHTRLLHYCGNRNKKFARMRRHFEALSQGLPLQIHFGLDEDAEDPSPASHGRPASATSAGRLIGINHDRDGVESHAVVNRYWTRELRRRGYRVQTLDETAELRPDVVIHHNFEQDFSALPILEGVPHVAVRTYDFGPFPIEWVERINSRYEQLWVHAERVRRHALEGGVEEERVHVVPHGIDPEVFRPVGESYPLATEKRFRFLFVGGTVVRKGIDTLLDAYTTAFGPDDDVCLVIKDDSANVFYRDTVFRERIRSLAADPRAPEVVFIDRHLPERELAALYRACNVGVWPYRAEGFLMPALESLACGTPTIVPEIGPTRDFSTHRTSFLVPTLAVRLPCSRQFSMRLGFNVTIEEVDFCEVKGEDLARVLRLAYGSDEATLKAKAAAGVAMAHGRFTWARSVDRIEECLGLLVHASGSRV